MQADVWSLGLILMECLLGFFPYRVEGVSAFDFCDAIVTVLLLLPPPCLPLVPSFSSFSSFSSSPSSCYCSPSSLLLLLLLLSFSPHLILPPPSLLLASFSPPPSPLPPPLPLR